MKKYLVSDGWGHIFVGNHESYTRWVLDVAAQKLVCGFVEERARWHPLTGHLLEDLQEDVACNILSEIERGTFEAEEHALVETDTLPDWQMNPEAVHVD